MDTVWVLCEPLVFQGQGHKRQLHYNLLCAKIEAILTLLPALLGTFHRSLPSLHCTFILLALSDLSIAQVFVWPLSAGMLLGCLFPDCPAHVE